MSDVPACPEPRRGDLLAAYELGLLEVRDRLAFEQHLEKCPQCLEEMYAHAPAAVLLRDRPGVYAAAADAALRATRGARGDRVGSADKAHGLRAVLARLLGAAWLRPRILAPATVLAVLLVLVVAPTLRRGSSLGDLAVVEPLPYARIELRGGADQGARLFQQGMDHYLQERYGQAADALAAAAEQLQGRSPDADPLPAGLHDQTRLYLGVSRLLDGQAAAAIEPLAAAAGSPLPPLAVRGRWYLAQAYLLCGKGDDARTTLAQLAANPVYGPQARRQLEALDKD